MAIVIWAVILLAVIIIFGIKGFCLQDELEKTEPQTCWMNPKGGYCGTGCEGVCPKRFGVKRVS